MARFVVKSIVIEINGLGYGFINQFINQGLKSWKVHYQRF